MSRLVEGLRAGKNGLGAWLFLGSADTAEVLGFAGFDALLIDHEHTPGGIETAVHQMRAIRAAGDSTILVRLGGDDPDRIKLVLDCGAEGLLLPNVESAEQARAFVAACRYPPRGRRGAHLTVSRAGRWGFHAKDYYRNAEAQLLLIAMIESEKGVRAIPEMAKVEGLSMLFLGPMDITASIDRMAQWSDPKVVALLREAESSVLANGMVLGGALVPGDSAADCLARGYRFVTVGSDVAILRQGAAQCLQGT